MENNIELFQVKFLIINAFIWENIPRYEPLYIPLSPLSSQIRANTRTRDRLSLSFPSHRLVCIYVYIHRIRKQPHKRDRSLQLIGGGCRESARLAHADKLFGPSQLVAPHNGVVLGKDPYNHPVPPPSLQRITFISHPRPSSSAPPSATPRYQEPDAMSGNCVAMATRGLAEGARSLKVSLSLLPPPLRFDSFISSLMNHFSKGD